MTHLRVLIAHNAYQQKGGEDGVVASESALLSSRGVDVAVYSRHNDDIEGMSRLALVGQTIWSSRTEADIAKWVADFRPDVIHAHNTFPLISPSLYVAADKAGVPVVQTLHNFRLFCPQAMLLRDGKVCEDCLGKSPLRGVMRGCYRGSKMQSAVIGGMQVLHRALGTYRNKVTRYIALNEFCRNKFIQGGLPAERIVVKPNFVDFPVPEIMPRRGLLFVGRLSEEKGVKTLVQAVTLLPNPDLSVAGDGPESHLLEGVKGITRLGSLGNVAVRHKMNSAVALVLPSIWYENFPRTIVEAFACGLPVIASRIGALADLMREGETGLLFEPGNSRDLADKMNWALAHPERMMEMGRKARTQYEAEFSAEVNYRMLMDIYEGVLDEC
jgi:glycosyltransferase involved in cell wall biosynthesis